MAGWLWAYSDRLSAQPGEEIALHLAGTGGRASIEIARCGADRRVVARFEGVTIEPHPVSDHAHIAGCGWPETLRVPIAADWTTGYHDVLVRGADGAEARHFFVVKASRPAARAAIVLATNTYHAYNWWGGANTYMWIGGPAPVAWPADPQQYVVAARLSTARPFSTGIMKPRSPAHRIVSRERRGFREPPNVGEIADEIMAGGEGWDCPAGALPQNPFRVLSCSRSCSCSCACA